MVRKYFGTDGIRGKANEGAMTAETALRVGMAAGRVFRRGDHRHRVVIGKDTRLSGYMLEPALTAGFTSMGMDVFLFGPLPTTYRKNKRPFHPSPTADKQLKPSFSCLAGHADNSALQPSTGGDFDSSAARRQGSDFRFAARALAATHHHNARPVPVQTLR